MEHEFALTRANRLTVARSFRHNKRVDFAIQCVVEGQLGRVFVDNPDNPGAFCIRVGPFGYFAGDTQTPGARRLMQAFPAYGLIMPSPVAWIDLAREVFGAALETIHRFTFSAAHLSAEHLAHLLTHSPDEVRIVPIGAELAAEASVQPDPMLDLSDFDSPDDFAERGFGYIAQGNGAMLGVAYSSLICSQGIEVSVYVADAYRCQGVATALCSRLLLDCLAQGLIPNWDAANAESIQLARKLGYHYVETYDAYTPTISSMTT